MAADWNLDAILQAAWEALQHGCERASHPFHTPVLATVGDDGAQARTVVLRSVDGVRRMLSCHTDLRSPKVAELRGAPRASWLFYDRASCVQLRCTGTAGLHHDDPVALERWQAMSPRSRACYGQALAPGAVSDDPGVGPGSRDGYENFAVIACTLDRIDWLLLREQGHVRALFSWQARKWQGDWIAP